MKKEDNDRPVKGMTRRHFIKSVGAGAVAATATGTLFSEGPADAKTMEAGDTCKVKLKVNGRPYSLLVEPRWTLVFVLREKLGLAGTKVGCERGECGSCTVLINGVPRYACMTLAVEVEGDEITTVEGLMDGEELGPVQEAFVEKDAFQCGYCTPGQIMAAEGLLLANPDPTPPEIQEAMSGNLCRCGAYVNIFQAVEAAAKTRKDR